MQIKNQADIFTQYFFNLHKRRELHRIELNDWKKLIGKFQV